MRGTCQLCERTDVQLTVHHLTPKECGGVHLPTALLCIPCHKQIHALYTNEELAHRLYMLERLKDDEKLAAFVKWIRKQPADRLPKIKKAKRQKR